MKTDEKAWSYAIAADSDIGAERFQQVRESKLWRGWVGTIYGCKVGTSKGALFDTRGEAIDNAKLMRDECVALHRANITRSSSSLPELKQLD